MFYLESFEGTFINHKCANITPISFSMTTKIILISNFKLNLCNLKQCTEIKLVDYALNF